VRTTKEDRGHEQRAIQEENTALARFQSEENSGSGPGSIAVCIPTPVNLDLGNLL
jgi:hypothetical protein